MSQTLPMTIDEYHILKTLDNLHEKYAVDSKGDIYTYIEKVKDDYIKTYDRKLLNFHESIKSFTVYDEFGESQMLTLSRSVDVVITYPTAPSPHKCVPYVSMRFFGKHPENKKYLQFVLLEFLTDGNEQEHTIDG